MNVTAQEREWDTETITEVVACFREAQAVYRTLVSQQLRLYNQVQQAERTLRKASHLYERCLQETATVPEYQRQIEALITERAMVTPQ